MALDWFWLDLALLSSSILKLPQLESCIKQAASDANVFVGFVAFCLFCRLVVCFFFPLCFFVCLF